MSIVNSGIITPSNQDPDAANLLPTIRLLTEVGSVSTGTSLGTTSIGRTLFVLTLDTLISVDITDPTTPTVLQTLTLGSNLHTSISVQGQFAYLVDLVNTRITIVDIKDPKNMTELFNAAPRNAAGFTLPLFSSIQGQFMYAGMNNGDLISIDISDPTDPFQTGLLALGSSIAAIAFKGPTLYVFLEDAAGSINSVDISDPTAMSLLDSLNIGGVAFNHTIQGSFIYTGGNTGGGADNGLSIVNIADPNNLVLTGSVAGQSSDLISSFFVYGDFVASFGAGAGSTDLNIYDVSDPTTPTLLRSQALANLSTISTGLLARFIFSTTAGFLRIYDLGNSIETESANIHSLEAGDSNTRGNQKIGGSINVATGATIGGDSFFQGKASFLGLTNLGATSFEYILIVATPGTVLITNTFVGIDTVAIAAASLITLFSAALIPPGGIVIIKAATFAAAANVIGIDPIAGQTIDGVAPTGVPGAGAANIAANKGVLRFFTNGANWFIW